MVMNERIMRLMLITRPVQCRVRPRDDERLVDGGVRLVREARAEEQRDAECVGGRQRECRQRHSETDPDDHLRQAVREP